MSFDESPSKSVEHVIVGGGEMGERMRALDWATTPLGPVEHWPQSLRSAVSILLPSRAQIVLFWGPDLIALYNDAYRPAFGAKHPWALGRPARECWREVWDVIRPLFESVMRTGEAFWAKDHLFYLERHGYPEETYFDVSYDPVRDESGGVGGVFCIVSETTGRVLGERRLRALRELGGEGTAKSGADVCIQAAGILAQNPQDVPFALFFVLDEAGRVACRVAGAGVTADMVVVADAIELDSPTPVAAVLGEACRSGRGIEAPPGLFVNTVPGPASSERVLVLPLLSGTQPAGILVAGVSRHLTLSYSYRDFFDLVAGRLSTAIATLRAYEEERRRAEALAELDRAKTVFFSNVSHEFRTPLTLLLGPLEDLLRAPVSAVSGEDRERLDVAYRNGLRLLKLVNSLLDFSRIEAGRIQAVYEPVDLASHTGELASAFRSLVEGAGLRFVVDCQPVGAVFVDREMWEKIVFNLLSNAFKHTFEGELRVSVRDADPRVELVVSDTGTGIAASDLPHIFERFHRIQKARARTQEGTGIGLALVAELVKLHDGRIDVTSEVDRGSTFVVSVPKGSSHLPADRVGTRRTLASTGLGPTPYVEEAQRWMLDHDDAVAPDASASRQAPVDIQEARILVADDNADMREYLRRLLGRHWAVETASDGTAALAAAVARPPDLVLTDVMMPGLDGFELLRALRADPRTRTVPVILLSARAGEESQVEGLDAGADDYLVKPFSARELVARVNAHLAMAAARRRFTEELEHERARFEAVLRQMPAGVIIAGAEAGRFELTNVQAERILGMRVSAGTLDSFPEDRLFYPDGRPYAREEWPMVRAMRKGEVILDEEVNFVRDDGTTIIVSVNATPIHDRQGRVVAGAVVFHDVTERKALLVREQAARADADAANRAKDQFLAVLSHELRTPLNAILGWTRLLLTAPLGEAERAHAVQVIERNTERQADLINDLLDISRITAGKLELDRVPVDLVPVVREAIDSLKADIEAKRLTVATDLSPTTGEVFADRLRIQQVVLNLLANAVKFTPAGGRIDVRLARHAEMARLTVTDTGPGIDDTLLPYIFEPFQQGDSSATRVHQGLGLGLAIVRELVNRHGGTVRAESGGKDQGSTFTIELPIIAVRTSPKVRPAEPLTPARGSWKQIRLDGLRVLVVDDQPDARELLALIVQQHGGDPRVAGSVAEALEVIGEGAVDVLVSDLAMPDVDGYDLIGAVRAEERRGGRKAIRAVALTAYSGHEIRNRALAAGFDAHATKPLEPEQLVELIAQFRRS